MELKPNMYVRTIKGKIWIITSQKAISGHRKDIIKASFNIIDLIERFDLVNGHLVICKMYENEKDIPTIVKCVGDYYFEEKDIKSIVTKEQFNSVKYEVE